MKHHTVSIRIDRPAPALLAYLGRPETLPEWAFHYCTAVRAEGDGHIAETCQGERRYAPQVDPATGVVDLRSWTGDGPAEVLPMRVHAIGDDASIVTATLLLPAEVPDEQFAQLCGFLQEELDRLATVAA
jgi:hypothetical protein